MSNITTFANGEVWNGTDFVRCNVVVEDGIITHLDETEKGVVYDLSGMKLFPGGIDPHVHLRDPGMTHKEDLITGGMAAARGGFTVVMDMPNTNPLTTTYQALFDKQKRAREAGIHIGFHFGVSKDNLSLIEGLKNLEPEQKPYGIKVYYGSSTGDLLMDKQSLLHKLFTIYPGPIIFHAELESCIKERMGQYTENDVSMHNIIRDNECAWRAVEQIISSIPDKCNSFAHFAHVSTREEIDLIRNAKQAGLPVTCEVTPHHLFLTEHNLEKLGNLGKMNPPLRSLDDQAALWEGISDGTVDCVATDHAPHLLEEKYLDYHSAPAGVPGLETSFLLLLKAVSEGKLTYEQVHDLRFKRAKEIFSVEHASEIEVGTPGDFTVLDESKPYIIKNKDIVSKCKWTPFHGFEVPGRIRLTCVNGHIVYKDQNYTLQLLT